MQNILTVTFLVALCLCEQALSQGWGQGGQQGGYGGQQSGYGGHQGGLGGQSRGFGGQQGGHQGWGQSRGFGGQQGGYGGQQGLYGGQSRGFGGQQGWGSGRSGRSPQGGQYGATLIDTPDMVGYEASIPGAESRFVTYRSARGSAGANGYSGQQQGGAQGGSWRQSQGQY